MGANKTAGIMRIRGCKSCKWIFLLPFMIGLLTGAPLEAKDRTSIGLVEEVVLLPWNVRLPARIDTGAAQTSLDARDIVIKGDIVTFRLPEKYGGLQLSLPIAARRTVRSAESIEQRTVVTMQMCVGDKLLHLRVNLNDRSRVKYPLLIGRNALRKNFIVDCMKEKCAPPVCPEVLNK